MPADTRKITRADVVSDAEHSANRHARRAALLEIKRLRRVSLGPYATFYFENYETMLFQVQEMLLVERGGEEQIADELAAYNPMIPQGDDLSATVMFEIDEPRRREAVLARLGNVEDCFFVQVGAEKVYARKEADVERTREDGKTSSVHFLHFDFTPAQKALFRDPGVTIMVGCDHEEYSHLAILSPASRAELAKDFA